MLDTDWLGTLDYPPVEIGFGLVTANSTTVEVPLALPPSLKMYPRNTYGRNNTVAYATVGRFGNAGIVTSQYSNTVSYSHVFSGGLLSKDSACVHADNSRTVCSFPSSRTPENRHECEKVWHHNWIHDCQGRCAARAQHARSTHARSTQHAARSTHSRSTEHANRLQQALVLIGKLHRIVYPPIRRPLNRC